MLQFAMGSHRFGHDLTTEQQQPALGKKLRIFTQKKKDWYIQKTPIHQKALETESRKEVIEQR